MKRGFTLIELLVVTGVIVVVSAVVLANQNRFGGQVLLQNFAYDVALSIRQAQVYGLAVVRVGSGAGSSFSASYGMHFDSSSTNNLNKKYNLFADTNKNGLWETGEDVAPSPYNIGRGYLISKLCSPAGTDINCTSGTVVPKLDIMFIRPEPDALISADSLSCISSAANCKASARIVLKSPRGDTMSVSVQANGQIAVDQKSAVTP